MDNYRKTLAHRITPDGELAKTSQAFPIEAAIAVEYGGIGYAVMMASPTDLIDFAYGFSLSEGVIDSPADIVDVETFKAEKGWLLKIDVTPERQNHVLDRARNRVSEGSCGICGIENLDIALRPLPVLQQQTPIIPDNAIFTALKVLRNHQPLNAATGGAHAAFFCDTDGNVILSREDVGRHNALDKLIGTAAQNGTSLQNGFLLLTSRCSYELVEKAVRAECPVLVTISTATTLAITRAAEARLKLITLARDDAILQISD